MGYQKVSLDATEFSLFGTQFFDIGESGIDIQSLVVGAEEGDSIQFFNGTDYEVYSFAPETYDDTYEVDYGPGWNSDETGLRAQKTIQPGQAFWYQSQTTKNVTFSGEVKTNATVTAQGLGSFQLVNIATPSTVDLQSVNFEGISEGDVIEFYNPQTRTYDTFSYAPETYDETYETDFGPGWNSDETGLRAEKMVDIGVGFWIQAAGAEITISR